MLRNDVKELSSNIRGIENFSGIFNFIANEIFSNDPKLLMSIANY